VALDRECMRNQKNWTKAAFVCIAQNYVLLVIHTLCKLENPQSLDIPAK